MHQCPYPDPTNTSMHKAPLFRVNETFLKYHMTM
jgi:hypothetical protein